MEGGSNTTCFLCNTEYQDKTLKCSNHNCKNSLCVDCLRKWFNEHKREDQIICRKGLQCLCGTFGFKQSSYYTKKYTTKELLLKGDRKWLFSKLKKLYKWDDLFIKIAIIEYIQFIKLKIQLDDINDSILAPSPIIDLIWVLHTKNQEKYIMFCTRINKNTIITRNEIKKDDDSIMYYNQRYSVTLSLLSDDSFREIDIWTQKQCYYRPSIQIFVKLIEGGWGTIKINYIEPVIILKYRLKMKFNLNPHNIRLISKGYQLDDNRSLDFYKILRDSNIFIVGRLRAD